MKQELTELRKKKMPNFHHKAEETMNRQLFEEAIEQKTYEKEYFDAYSHENSIHINKWNHITLVGMAYTKETTSIIGDEVNKENPHSL